MTKLIVFLASLFFTHSAFAVFGVEAVGGNSGESSNRTVAFTVTSANLLIACVGIGVAAGDLAEIGGVTWNGVAMTAISGGEATDANWVGVKCYRMNSPAAGSFNAVADTVATNQSALCLVSFTDANIAGTPIGTPSTATATTANPSVTVADSANGEIVVSMLATDGATGATTAAGTSICDLEDVGTDTDHNAQRQTATGANTVASWTNSGTGDGWAAVGFAITGTGGGGGVKVNPISGRGGSAAAPVVLGN